MARGRNLPRVKLMPGSIENDQPDGRHSGFFLALIEDDSFDAEKNLAIHAREHGVEVADRQALLANRDSDIGIKSAGARPHPGDCVA